MGCILGLYRDNGKENGSYYLGLGFRGLRFRGLRFTVSGWRSRWRYPEERHRCTGNDLGTCMRGV